MSVKMPVEMEKWARDTDLRDLIEFYDFPGAEGRVIGEVGQHEKGQLIAIWEKLPEDVQRHIIKAWRTKVQQRRVS